MEYGGLVCFIASDNNGYCSGYNYSGIVGNGTYGTGSKYFEPTAVDRSGALAGLTLKHISGGGGDQTCAIASDNNAYCWGVNTVGQLGNKDRKYLPSYVPIAVYNAGALSGLTVTDISSGAYNTCVIASNGMAYCWGEGQFGQIGNSSTSDVNQPTQVLSTGALNGLSLKMISNSYSTVCVVASNDLGYCWGNNGNGKTGDGTVISPRTVPVAVDTSGALSGLTLRSIDTGDAHTCAVASDDNIYCWGANSQGEIGDGTTSTNRITPTLVVKP